METSPENSGIEASALANPAIASPWQVFWQRLRRQRTAMIGGVILIILYLTALFAGFVAPYGYERQDRERFFHRPMALRWQGGLAVQQYQPAPGTSKYEPVQGEAKRIHFFVRGDK